MIDASLESNGSKTFTKQVYRWIGKAYYDSHEYEKVENVSKGMTNLEKVDLDQAVRKARQNNFVEKRCCQDNVIGTLGMW